MDGLAGAENAAVEPDESIERAGMGAPGGAAVGQVEAGGFEVQRHEIIAAQGVDGSRRDGALAAQQRRVEARHAIRIGLNLGQDLVVGGNQRQARTRRDAARLQAARLHRQPGRAAPGGQAQIGDEDGQHAGQHAVAAAAVAGTGDQQEQAGAGGAQRIGQRQDGALGDVGGLRRELGAAFPHHSAEIFGQVIRLVTLQIVERAAHPHRRHQRAFRHPHQPQVQRRQVDGAQPDPGLLAAGKDVTAAVEGDARLPVGHGDGHAGVARQAQPVLARQSGAQQKIGRAAMRQAGGADLAPLTRDRKAGDGGFSPDPVGRLPVGALRGRHGEADAGAGRLGLGIGRDTGD